MSRRYDARALRASWDRQQNWEIPSREWRFERILDLLESGLPSRPRILDLGCGTGALAERVLRRLPAARVWALDYDPVVLRIGREGLGDMRGRLMWLEADLSASRWAEALPRGRFDAVVSTTALHWLYPRTLRRVYRTLAGRVRTGGLFLNGDTVPFEPDQARIADIARRVRTSRLAHRPRDGALAWGEWWAMARSIPALAGEFAERDRRYATVHGNRSTHAADPPVSWHLRALRAAGFSEAGVVWSLLANRIILAVR